MLRAVKLFGVGAALVLLVLAAGNSGQFGWAQGGVRTLSGHYSYVNSVAFSPDGRLLASGSFDTTVKLWEVASGREVRTLSHRDAVLSVAFSPDGRLLASGGCKGGDVDDHIQVWDVSTGQRLRFFQGHSDCVNSVAFSPDGRLLASGSWDKTVKLWDVASGNLVRTLSGHSSDVNSVAFSPDGRLLASGSADTTVKLWDVASGNLVRTLSGHRGRVTSVAFSPDGRLLASGSFDATIKLWDVASGNLVRTLSGHRGPVYSAFSPDGRLLASGSFDNTVKLWEVASGREVPTLSGHSSWVWSVAFSPDGRLLASGSCGRHISGPGTSCVEGEIKLWDISDLPSGPAIVLFWVSRFTSGDSENRVINFVQLIPQAGKCGILDNVDLVNRTGSSANDFEIVVEGTYSLVEHYTDPRYPARFEQVPSDSRTLFRWIFNRDVPPGNFAHLGLWVWAADCNIRIKSMTWTRNGSVIGKVPAVSVRTSPSGQVEVVNSSDESISVSAVRWASVPQPLPLPLLNANDLPVQLQRQGASLQPVPNVPDVVQPGQALPLPGVVVPQQSTAPTITDIWVFVGSANDGRPVSVWFAVYFTDPKGDVTDFIVGCRSSDSGAVCAPPYGVEGSTYKISAQGIKKGRVVWKIICTMDSHVRTSYWFTLADAAGLKSETSNPTYFTGWKGGVPILNRLPVTQCTRLEGLYVESTE